MPKYRNQNNNNDVCGLIVFMEINLIYIVDLIGEICCISLNQHEINQIQLNHVYHFKNLYFIKKDERNYLLYDIKKHTSFKEVYDKEPFKKITIIKFIFLDDTRKNKNSMIRVNNKTMYIRDKIQYITSSKDDNSSYYLEEFNLKIENEIKTFNLFVIKVK